jgi:hypothetical protein
VWTVTAFSLLRETETKSTQTQTAVAVTATAAVAQAPSTHMEHVGYRNSGYIVTSAPNADIINILQYRYLPHHKSGIDCCHIGCTLPVLTLITVHIK